MVEGRIVFGWEVHTPFSNEILHRGSADLASIEPLAAGKRPDAVRVAGIPDVRLRVVEGVVEVGPLLSGKAKGEISGGPPVLVALVPVGVPAPALFRASEGKSRPAIGQDVFVVGGKEVLNVGGVAGPALAPDEGADPHAWEHLLH